MKNSSIIAITAFVMVIIGCGFANAEPIAFEFDGLFDWGTSYTYNGAGTWIAGTAANPSNPYDGSVSQNLVNGVTTAPDGKEDSYGIARIGAIRGMTSGLTYFDRATSPYEITIFFYGFDDTYISGTTGFVELLSRGGHAKVYQDFSPDYNPSIPPTVPPDRTAVDQMNAITDGTLVLDLTPHTLVDPVGGAFTLENNFNFTTYRGTGSAYFDVTGGAWQGLYDTDMLIDGSDISIAFSSLPAVQGAPGVLDSRNWLVRGTAEGQANLVPEPMSMIMIGMGLLGVGAAQRKRKKTV